jgi:hypothetical protein
MKMRLNRMKKVFAGLIFICCFICTASTVHAQIYNDTSKKFKVYLEAYIMFTSMSGTNGFGNLPNAFICVPASKVFSYLKIGGMLYGEVHNDQLAFTSDLFYADLQQDASSKNGIISGTAGLKQFWWELEGLYRINPWFELGAGARINNISGTLNLNAVDPGGTGSVSKSGTSSNTWVDPLIVTRLKTVIDNRWLLQLRADVGGFGVGSKIAWQLQPDIFYRCSRLLVLGLGYRILSTDYEKGSGSDRFLFDMDEYGPQIKIGFNL